MKRNPKDSLKEYQKRFVRNFSGALNKWVREFLPPDNYGEFFLALNDDLSDRKFYNREDVRYIAEDPLTSLKYSGFIVVEFLDGEMGDELTKEFAVSFLPLDYERARLPSMVFSKLRIPEFMQKDVPCRKGSFCDPFVVGKDNPANIGDYYTDHFCSTFKFSSPTKGYVLDFKGIRSNTANIFQLLLESRLVCDSNLEIIINDSNLKGIYDWEEAVSILGSLRDEGSSPKPMKPSVLFEGMGIPMGSKVYFTIRMIYWDKEKAGQVARNTAQDIYLIENHSQHGESKPSPVKKISVTHSYRADEDEIGLIETMKENALRAARRKLLKKMTSKPYSMAKGNVLELLYQADEDWISEEDKGVKLKLSIDMNDIQ